MLRYFFRSNLNKNEQQIKILITQTFTAEQNGWIRKSRRMQVHTLL